MSKNKNQIDFLSKIEWKYLLVFLIIGFVLQVLFGKLIPWIFSKLYIQRWDYILGWDYLLGMLFVWFLMYLVFAFIIYRKVTEYKFLHIVFLVIAATILFALLGMFTQLIDGQRLITILGHGFIMLFLVIPLLIAGIIGFFSAKIYSKRIKESTLFMKLSLPIATLISLGSVLLMVYSNAIRSPGPYVSGSYAILMTAFNSVPYLISKILFLFLGPVMYESPWFYLWFLVIYYTLFFFWLAFCHMKFKEERNAKWIIFLILPIIIHIVFAFLGFFLIFLGIAYSG